MSINHVNKMKKLLLSQEFQRFFIVGVTAFLLDFGLLNFMTYILDFRVVLFDLIYLPNIISTVTAVIYGFILQKRWTFKDTSSAQSKIQLTKYFSVHLLNLILYNSILFGILLNLGVLIPIAKIITNTLQMFSSYILFKKFVFKK